MTIKMVITTKRIASSYNHKKERMRTTKIKIVIKRIANDCNHKRERTRTMKIKTMTKGLLATATTKEKW
jgi:hypothetical protein